MGVTAALGATAPVVATAVAFVAVGARAGAVACLCSAGRRTPSVVTSAAAATLALVAAGTQVGATACRRLFPCARRSFSGGRHARVRATAAIGATALVIAAAVAHVAVGAQAGAVACLPAP